MARSISDILRHSGLCGMLLITGPTGWTGVWLPLSGREDEIRLQRNSNSGDALARAATANH